MIRNSICIYRSLVFLLLGYTCGLFSYSHSLTNNSPWTLGGAGGAGDAVHCDMWPGSIPGSEWAGGIIASQENRPFHTAAANCIKSITLYKGAINETAADALVTAVKNCIAGKTTEVTTPAPGSILAKLSFKYGGCCRNTNFIYNCPQENEASVSLDPQMCSIDILDENNQRITLDHTPVDDIPSYTEINVCPSKAAEVINIVGEGIKRAAGSVGKAFKEGLYEGFLVDIVYKRGLVPTGAAIEKYGKIGVQMLKNLFTRPPTPDFCKYTQAQLNAMHSIELPALITDPATKKKDDEGMIPWIEKYSPVFYLHREEARFPIWASEYFNAPTTGLYCGAPGAAPCRAQESVVVPSGTVNFKKQYELYQSFRVGKREANLMPLIADCTRYGSNPALNTASNGDLNTPVYVVWYRSKDEKYIYIQYITFYGYNEPYDIGPITGESFELMDYHDSDIEHVTLKLDAASKKLLRIYYGAHGLKEGCWVDAQSNLIQYEGTHPVFLVARGGHGLYTREGVFVRIHGVANDYTSKDIRWVPQMILLYPEYDPQDPHNKSENPRYPDERFDPVSMGWIYHPGTMGKDGVGTLASTPQGWFMNSEGGDLGGSCYDQPYCPTTKVQAGINEAVETVCDILHMNCRGLEKMIDTVSNICIASKIPDAKPPSD